jgi:hypothetical protein
MKYTEFVKANYNKVANLPPKQRMAELGKMWKNSGHSSGKGVAGGEVAGGKKSVKKARGKGIISSALGAFGLGVKGKGKKKDVGKVEGKGVISDTLGAFGLGMKKRARGRPAKGKGVVGGDISAMDLLGLAMPDDVKHGISDVLSMLGGSVPDKIKMKHLNRMKALEKQLHEKGKLTASQGHKLKVYHALHGSGFFDSILKFGKKAMPAVINALPQVIKVLPEVAKYVPAVGKIVKPLQKVAPLAAML